MADTDSLRKESRALDGLFGAASGSGGERASFFTESMCEPASGKSFAEMGHEGEGSQLVVEKQMTGHLYKKAISGKRNWKRRYFVLKDGMLLYYDARDRPMIYFDFHPKGVLPLDSCSVDTCRDGPNRNMRFGIEISHSSFGGKSLVLCAETSEDQDRWYQALENCRFITYGNALAGTQQIEALQFSLNDAQEKLQNVENDLRKTKEKLAYAKRKKTSLAGSRNRLKRENESLREAIRRTEQQHNISIDVPEASRDSDDTEESDDVLEGDEDDDEESNDEEEEEDGEESNDEEEDDNNKQGHTGNDNQHTPNKDINGRPIPRPPSYQRQNHPNGEDSEQRTSQVERALRVEHLTSMIREHKQNEEKDGQGS